MTRVKPYVEAVIIREYRMVCIECGRRGEQYLDQSYAQDDADQHDCRVEP